MKDAQGLVKARGSDARRARRTRQARPRTSPPAAENPSVSGRHIPARTSYSGFGPCHLSDALAEAALHTSWHTAGNKEARTRGAADEAEGAVAAAREPSWLSLDTSISDDAVGLTSDPFGDHPVGHSNAALAELLHARKTIQGSHGTTFQIKTALHALVGPGDTILVERDCHVSAIQSLVEIDARVRWITPPFDAGLGLNLAMTPDRLAAALDANPEATAVWLTSPKYFGIAGHVDELVALAHARGVRIGIDEAHGAHFPFHPAFPRSAVAAGADLVTQSWHKTTEALSGASVLIINDDTLVDRVLLTQHGVVCQSTSPYFGTPASIELAAARLARDGERLLGAAMAIAADLRRGLAALPGIDDVDVPPGEACAGMDPLRVTIDVSRTGATGLQLDRALQRMGIVPELATLRHLLFIVTYGNTKRDVVETVEALRDALALAPAAPATRDLPALPQELPEQIVSPRAAHWRHWRGDFRTIAACRAPGLVAAETIAVYPPGSALIVQGERYSAEIVNYLVAAATAGAHLKGASDQSFATVRVLDVEA